MQEYSEGGWPMSDMMSAFPEGWSEVIQEMLPANECDFCGPPLDIGPPPPLPANFQNKADLPSGNCNICHVIHDVEARPTQLSEASLLPILSALLVGIVLISVTLAVLVAKIKKCRAFFPRASGCWIFPRNLLPHTELAPSSLPSPSPSTEKLKGESRPWNGSSRSLQSENIYEVCSPPSQDSLYEEVGPPVNGKDCSPYGVVLMDKPSLLVSTSLAGRDAPGKFGSSRALLDPGFAPGVMGSQQKPVFVGGMLVPHFSTFGGSGRGFFNPIVRETAGNGRLLYPGSSNTMGCPGSRSASAAKFSTGQSPMQKRKLPPVPNDGPNFSL